MCALKARTQGTGLLAATLALAGLGPCRGLGILMAATPVTGATTQLLVTDFTGVALNALGLYLSSRRRT